ncbi:MAG: PEP-CTERM sorting domain-containing protein [Planctomycetaceae bacterium]
MKRLLWSLVVVPVFMAINAPSADASALAFMRAFRPVVGGVNKNFDSVAVDHTTGNIYVKEVGGVADSIKIHKFSHNGILLSSSSITGLGSNGEEFGLNVVTPNTDGGTINVNGSSVGEGKLLLTNGEGTETVYVLNDLNWETPNEITYTGISRVLGGAAGRTGGAMNYTTNAFYTVNNNSTDLVRTNNLATGTVATVFSPNTPNGTPTAPPSAIRPNLPFDANGDSFLNDAYNVAAEGDIAVHQSTGNLYVVSSYSGNHLIRVFNSTGGWLEDINLDVLLAGQVDILGNPISGGESGGMSGIAVEAYGWNGHNPTDGAYTAEVAIWLVTKQGWIIHLDSTPPPPIPEPGTLSLLGLGSLALVLYRRRQSKQA